MRPLLCIIVFLLSAWLISGCATEQEAVKPAQELFDEAAALAKKGDVEKASEAFLQVRTYYPAHDLARKSLLRTADLYYDNEDYESALKSYDEFRVLYPTDPDAGYALFRIAMCHHQQMGTFDRDQSDTLRAIQNFEAFLKSYPGSPYTAEASEKLKEARTLVAKHDFSIGKYYLKRGKTRAACARFQTVKRQYPDVDLGEEIDSLIATACTSSDAAPAE